MAHNNFLPSSTDISALISGKHPNPHSILGAHEYDDHTVIRVLRPHVPRVSVVIGDEILAMHHLGDGLWQIEVPYTNLGDYRLWVHKQHKDEVIADAYRFLPTLGELDQHLVKEGRHEKLWDILGAHEHTYTTLDGKVTGISFAVWAPNAQGVHVIGDFNNWNHNVHPMRLLGSTGVWELFLPEAKIGDKYKFAITGEDGTVREKADPLAQYAEKAPSTASIVYKSSYRWKDSAWMRKRAQTNILASPMSIYEVHLDSWKNGLSYRDLAKELPAYLTQQGFTHVEFLPVAEHPFGGSWGYQVTSYYAPTSRYGTPDDLRYLIDKLHQAGIGVIIDWVPAHFPKDEWALAKFDGSALYEHSDPRRGEQKDWGTYVFNFGRIEVRNFLVANALYWFDEFHADGIRVDAVASMLYLDYSRADGEWLPNEYGGRENLEAVNFIQEVNGTVHKLFPGVATIAEESTAWPGVTKPTSEGGLGFTFKWNMGWMHDTINYFHRDPVHRGFHHHEITFSLMYAWSENYLLPFSHDEVVHGKGSLWNKMPGNSVNKAAELRTLLAYQWAHPGKQLIFMGQEFGQTREWADNKSLEWNECTGFEGELHAGLQKLVQDLNRVYVQTPALWDQDGVPEGYVWIEANDANNNVLSFLRFSKNDGLIACVYNLSGVDYSSYRLGLPYSGVWEEMINTDAVFYAGRGIGNFGEVIAEENYGWHAQPHSAEIILPSHTAIWLKPKHDTKHIKANAKISRSIS